MTTLLDMRPAPKATPRTEAVFGRGRDCDVVFNDPGVSLRHLRVTWTCTDPDRAADPAVYRYQVTDLDSQGGTRLLRGLNMYRLEPGVPADVVDGDQIIIGHTWLRVGRH